MEMEIVLHRYHVLNEKLAQYRERLVNNLDVDEFQREQAKRTNVVNDCFFLCVN